MKYLLLTLLLVGCASAVKTPTIRSFSCSAKSNTDGSELTARIEADTQMEADDEFDLLVKVFINKGKVGLEDSVVKCEEVK